MWIRSAHFSPFPLPAPSKHCYPLNPEKGVAKLTPALPRSRLLCSNANLILCPPLRGFLLQLIGELEVLTPSWPIPCPSLLAPPPPCCGHTAASVHPLPSGSQSSTSSAEGHFLHEAAPGPPRTKLPDVHPTHQPSLPHHCLAPLFPKAHQLCELRPWFTTASQGLAAPCVIWVHRRFAEGRKEGRKEGRNG